MCEEVSAEKKNVCGLSQMKHLTTEGEESKDYHEA